MNSKKVRGCVRHYEGHQEEKEGEDERIAPPQHISPTKNGKRRG